MAFLPKSKLWRTIIVLGGFTLLVAIFYAEENWRGKRAWENCKRELEARGEIVDWDKLIPPPVLDDQNFFKAPKMQEWFVNNWHSDTNELADRLRDVKFQAMTASVSTATNLIQTADEAKDYLVWSDQSKPDFDLIGDALKRPYARMEGDYREPIIIPIPDFVSIRVVAQMLSQRAHCYLLLGQPNKALDELTLLNNLRRTMEAAPSGKPITSIAMSINLAAAGIYLNTISDGLHLHTWREPQLVSLQRQLKKINFAPIVAKSFELESATWCWTFKNLLRKYPNDPSLWQNLKHFRFPWGNYMPSGWVYQNMVTIAKLQSKLVDSTDFENGTILPERIETERRQAKEIHNHFSFYTFLARFATDADLSKIWQTTAHNQTLVNEAQIACALERCHLAHGKYPETLDALAPQFIEKIPHDIIGGQPLHYRRTDDGKFLLYSVGWNEIDDGGQEPLTKGGVIDYTNGDWVWKN